MSIDELANYVTMLVSFMNVTIGALTSYLFQTQDQSSQSTRSAGTKKEK